MPLKESHSALSIAPVLGVSLSEPVGSPIPIGDGVVLDHLDQLPVGENWRRYFGEGDYLKLSDASLSLTNTFSYEGGYLAHSRTRESELDILHALLTLWIYRPTAARITHFFHIGSPDPNATPHSYNRLHQTFSATGESAPLVPAELDAEILSRMYKNIRAAFADKRPMRIALWHLFASQRMPQWETRFVSLCVVLESLFSTGTQEITHKLSERIAVFMGGGYRRYKEIKRFYAMRSKIVHGQDLKVKDGEESGVLIGSLEDVVHHVLKKILADNEYVDRFNRKKNKEDYLNRMVFDSGSAV